MHARSRVCIYGLASPSLSLLCARALVRCAVRTSQLSQAHCSAYKFIGQYWACAQPLSVYKIISMQTYPPKRQKQLLRLLAREKERERRGAEKEKTRTTSPEQFLREL